MSETTCDYCGSEELAYELESHRGPVCRCIECLAIEQGQQQLEMPFDTWLERDELEAPDVDPFDPRKHDYKTARAWFTVLARIKDDDPIVKRDPDAIGTIFEDTREFLINIMGEAAHYPPSEIIESDGDPAQTELS